MSNREYIKTHYKSFKVDLRNDVYNELVELINSKGITKAQFFRDCIESYKILDKLKNEFKKELEEEK